MVIEADSSILVAVFAIFFFAGAVKGVLGFGLPIITMSMLPFVMPIEKAIALSAVVQPATNVFQWISAGQIKASIELAWPVLITLAVGILVGSWYVTSLDSQTLILLVGLTIIVFSLMDLLGYRIPISSRFRLPAGLGFGFVAGVFGAFTALNGWAFILYLLGIGTDRQLFRSTIALLFLVSGLLISSSFWLLGWLNYQVLLLSILALIAAFPGMWFGNQLGERLPAALFRRVILTALVCVGSILMFQGVA
ncbi:MAG: sulfite exporter TauE/SafE family protein [Pseudomonadota bacterium]